MTKRFRLILILVLMALAFYFLYPTIQWYAFIPQSQKDLAAGSRTQIRLYAERMAGDSLRELLGADLAGPLPGEYSFLIDHARDVYRSQKKPFPRVWAVQDVLRTFAGRGDLTSVLESRYRDQIFGLKELRDRTMQLGLDLRGGIRVLIRSDIAALEQTQGRALSGEEREDAMRRALEILNNRIDQFGVTEPTIQRQGEDMIVVELPGEADPERIRQFIQGKGQLTFHIVDEEGLAAFREYQRTNPGAWINEQGEIIQPPILPAGTRLLGLYEKDAYGIDILKDYSVIRSEVGLSGTAIRDARVSSDPITAEPLVHFFLSSEGGEIFYKLTSANVDKTLAVVLDDKVKSQARIAEPIRDQVRVTGFTQEEAADLALVLRTGALPVPLEIINQEAVGATLGDDAIRAGMQTMALAFAVVILFMLVYYKGAGLIADIALLLNLYLMVVHPVGVQLHPHPAGHRRGGAHPGHGGGRQRADLRAHQGGVGPGQVGQGGGPGRLRQGLLGHRGLQHHHVHRRPGPVRAGQGTHPGIRGVAGRRHRLVHVHGHHSLAAAVRLPDRRARSRADQHQLEEGGSMKRVIHFTRLRWVMISISVTLILAGIVVGIARGGINYGVDFNAGLSQQVQIRPEGATATIDQVREALAPLGRFDLQAVGSPREQRFTIKIQADEQEPGFQQRTEDQIRNLLGSAFGAGNVAILSSDFVGPRYSRELAGQTVSIVAVAVILILIYTAFRFKVDYGVAAVLCLLHDALFMIAVTMAFRLEFDTATIAAILTIIGYSINDTIVIFDRVREDVPLMRDVPLATIFDTAITQTLSRTILTSLTVLFTVLAIFVFTTGSIKNFALLMLVGVLEGVYSTIFIASPLVLFWQQLMGRGRRAREVKRFGQLADRPAGAAAVDEATGVAGEGGEGETAPAGGPADGTSGAEGGEEEHPAVAVTRVQPSRKKKKKKH